MSYVNYLEQPSPSPRERLIEDIDAIIRDWWDATYEDNYSADLDVLINTLSEAVCANYPVS